MKDDDSNQSQTEGDHNQVIETNIGTAIGNVEGNVFLNQFPQRALSLHQLPADISDFTGRKDEIENILRHLKRGETVAISAVAGMPGVGKSALTIHVAHQLAAAEFPDVQLYIDLRGADGNALEPADVLAQWLRAFGLDESAMPQNLRERSSVFRSLLSGKRAIVVLDNARDESQLRPLLPGSQTCAVIVTSRRVLGALEGAAIVNLQVLSEPEALELLERLIGAARIQQELAEAKEIVLLCGRLPLAIRIVGGALKMKPHWKLLEYAQWLADEKQRLSHLQLSDLDVRASFELSYRELTDTDASLFCWLGILEGEDFGSTIADVLAEARNKGTAIVERLVEAQLLEAHSDRRYRFHDLIRLFARQKLEESNSLQQRSETKKKLIVWWGEILRYHDQLLNPVSRQKIFQRSINETSVSSKFNEQNLPILALSWFEQERQHLLSSVVWANEEKMWNEVIFLAENLVDFCKIRFYLTDAEKACELAINAAKQKGDFYRQGVAFNNLGIIYQAQNRSNESIKVCQKGFEISQSLDTCPEKEYLQQLVLNNLGLAYRSQRRWTEAIDYFQKSQYICQNLCDRYGEATALQNLGTVFQDKSLFSNAISLYKKALDIFRNSEDRYGEGLILNNLGGIYKVQGLWDESIKHFEQSLSISQEFCDRKTESYTLMNLGNLYGSQGCWDVAMSYFTKSLAICRELKDPYGEGESLNNIGVWYQNQNQWHEALKWLTQSLEIREQISDRQGIGQTLNNLGIVYHAQNLWSESIRCFRESLVIYQELGALNEEGNTLGNLGSVYQLQKHWIEAVECYKRSIAIKRELGGDRFWEGQVLNNLGSVYNSQNLWADAIECFQQSLDIYRELGDRHGEGTAFNNLGIVYRSQGLWPKAIEYYQQSLDIYRELGDHHGEGENLANLGRLYELQDQQDQAIQLWQEALTKIPRDTPDYDSVTEWLENAQNPKPKQNPWIKQIPFLLFGGVVLLIVVGIQGTLIVAGVMLLISFIVWIVK
jgi:tetratricopeptide (TPR) repeat protein